MHNLPQSQLLVMEELVKTPPPPSLPEEMVFEILLRLPEKNLNRCKCVSKPWRSLITTPEFVQAYRARHPAAGLLAWVTSDDVPLPFLSSDFCYSSIGFRRPAQPFRYLELLAPVPGPRVVTDVINGLVCCYDTDHLFLANVFTGEVKQLPRTGNSGRYIFGFDAVNGVYKLLGLGSRSLEILSLGLGGWRKVDMSCRLMQRCRSFVAVDNVLYSLLVKKISHYKYRCYLVSFDLSKEKVQFIKTPKGITSTCLLSHYAVELGGRLALANPNSLQGCRLSLCILEDGEGNVWSKRHIPLPAELKEERGMTTVSSGNLPDGRMLLFKYEYAEGSLTLDTPIYSYDHQTCEFEKLFVGKLPYFLEVNFGLSRTRMLCVEENCAKFDDLFDETKPSRGDTEECRKLV